MRIIDTHQHLWDTGRFSFSWCKDIPLLNRSFHMDDYMHAIEGTGIEKSVHVEADVDEPFMIAETEYILALAEAKDNPLAGVVACGRPEKSGFREYLDQIAGYPALKGIRRVLHTQPDEVGRSEMFVKNLEVLPSYGLSFDICIRARQLPIAINLVGQCPGVSFILDHCGVPRVSEKQPEAWRRDIREISGFPNVVCKISGLVTEAGADWTPGDLRPYVDYIVECFGWDRVMFGSDWPVCTLSSTLARWVKTLDELTRAAPQQDREKLFYKNAARVYRLSV